jgi:hypothetical protein
MASTLKEELMSIPALFNCSYVGTCIEHPHKSNWVSHPPVAFVKILWVPSVLAHILHVLISLWFKWPHLKMTSCWTCCEHPPCSHILHACQPGYTPQKHHPCKHFELSVPLTPQKHMLTQPTRPECSSLRQCPSHNQYSMPSVGSYISRCRSGHLSISVFCISSFSPRESLYLCRFDSFRSLSHRFWWNLWHVKSKH